MAGLKPTNRSVFSSVPHVERILQFIKKQMFLLNYVIKKGFMLSVCIWSNGREQEDWRAQVARGDFVISQCFISTSVAFFAGDTKCFRAIKKR